MKQLLLSGLVLLKCSLVWAQQYETTELLNKLKTISAYEQKADILYELSQLYQRTNPDSAYSYATQLETLAKENRDNTGQRKAALMMVQYLNRTGKPNEALALCEKNIALLARDTGNRPLSGNFCMARGQSLMALNKKQEALGSFYTSLKIAEQENAIPDIVGSRSNIGWVYMELGQNEKALTEFMRAKNLAEANMDKVPSRFLSVVYNNMASCYGAGGKIDSAYLYTDKGIAIALKNNDYADAANGLNLEGEALMEEKKYDAALQKLLQAKTLREKVGDPFFIVSDMALLAQLYGAMGKTPAGIKTSKEAIAIARQNKLDAKLPLLYQALANNYEYAGNYKEAAAAYKYINQLKDTLFEKASAQSLAQMQVQYETEKKETENTLLKKENALKEAQIYNKNRTIYILIGGALLVATLLFAWVMAIRLRKRKGELKAISDLQKEKERIARDLHDNVGGQLSYIIYSLDGINEESKEKRTEITESINRSVRSVIGSLRETIWAISDANIRLQDFSDKLKLYARNLFSHTDVKIHFTENIRKEKELNALLGLNLYRICQEMLTNAFKYSQAAEIKIDLQTDAGKFIIVIADNGKGFDVSQQKEECYGLQNIRKRTTEFGIDLTLETAAGRGAKYRMVV